MPNDIVGRKTVYIVTGYTDIRKGIDGLVATVWGELYPDLYNKALFLFYRRNPSKPKGLLWEGYRFLLCYPKRREKRTINLLERTFAMSIKSETFKLELETIKNDRIRQFCIEMLEDAPDYFFTVPASSTGKYHPKFAQGEQGLIRHTKALVGIANDLLALEQFDFNNETKDMIRVAGILHDAKKHGDCLILMKDIPCNFIDLTVTSPPYDNLRTYNGNISQWSFEKFQSIAKELYRITKSGGTVVWIVSDATVNGSETGTSFRQVLFFKDIGFNIHDTMIWGKPTFTSVGALKTRYAQVFEYMFVLTKGKIKTFNPIKDRANKYGGDIIHSNIRQINGDVKLKSTVGKSIALYGQRFNVWKMNTCVSNAERTGHPAQFPEQLANDHIISWSNENDVILDPFMGSGTVGKMAKLNNRKFIGIELDENYFEIAKERIEKA